MLTFQARVDGTGHLHLVDRHGFRRAVRTFAGTSVDLVLRRHAKHRSDRQSRYYFGVVVAMLAEHLGYTRDEMHDALKLRFLRLEDADHPLPTVRSTASLTSAEFERYLEDVRIFAASTLGVIIPLPNEAETSDYGTGATQRDEDSVAQFDADAETIATLAASQPTEPATSRSTLPPSGDQSIATCDLETASVPRVYAVRLSRGGV
jgi:hypothetical protein